MPFAADSPASSSLSPGDVLCTHGLWLESAVANVPNGELHWSGLPRRVYTASIDGRSVLATVRRALHQPTWVVSMPGFVWDVSGEKGSTTTRQLGIDSSPSRGFASSQLAKRAVKEAYASLKTHWASQSAPS